MKAGLIAALIIAVVAWLLDGLIYSTILMPSQEMMDFMKPVSHSEDAQPGMFMWLFYELPRIGILCFALFQRPLSLAQGATYGAIVTLLINIVNSVMWMMFINVPMDPMMGVLDLVLSGVVGAICGAGLVWLFNKLGGKA